MHNKWVLLTFLLKNYKWDNYNNEKVVWIDDITNLRGSSLLNWADRYILQVFTLN